MRIKALVDRFVKELQKALDADIQDRIMKEQEMPATLGAQTRGH